MVDNNIKESDIKNDSANKTGNDTEYLFKTIVVSLKVITSIKNQTNLCCHLFNYSESMINHCLSDRAAFQPEFDYFIGETEYRAIDRIKEQIKKTSVVTIKNQVIDLCDIVLLRSNAAILNDNYRELAEKCKARLKSIDESITSEKSTIIEIATDFYYRSFLCVKTTYKGHGPKIYLREQIEPANNVKTSYTEATNINRISTQKFTDLVGMLSNTLGVSKYQAAVMILPDYELGWSDVDLDKRNHALKPYEDTLNNSSDIIKTIRGIDNDKLKDIISLVNDEDRIMRGINKIYSYNNHIYVKRVFCYLTKTRDNMCAAYEKMRDLLAKLCKSNIIAGSSQSVKSFGKCIANLLSAYEIEPKKIEGELDRLCILFFRYGSIVILEELTGEQQELNICFAEVSDDELQRYTDILFDINMQESDSDRIRHWLKIYNMISKKGVSEEFVNHVCNDIYDDFFKFINNLSVQAALSGLTANIREAFIDFYNLVYDNVKFKLYRGYKHIGDNHGLMRNSLSDREIAQQFLLNNQEEFVFSHRKSNYSIGHFALRLANESDISSIIKLNNPPEPYRRAIYVKSENSEITDGVSNKDVYIIEEICSNGEKIPACVAVILRYTYNVRKGGYNTDLLNIEYERAYFNEIGKEFQYLDFDSVLVNDGKSGLTNHSYRGCGFQRFFLVLAEEIARKENRAYICATVSTLNRPSKRNFVLNGYDTITQKAYDFDGESDYLKHINSTDTQNYDELVLSEYKDNESVFNALRISMEDYRQEIRVPRDFVVLRIDNR